MSANKESTGRYQPVAKAGMLIRKPVAEVFEALVNPRDHVQVLVQQRQQQIGGKQAG